MILYSFTQYFNFKVYIILYFVCWLWCCVAFSRHVVYVCLLVSSKLPNSDLPRLPFLHSFIFSIYIQHLTFTSYIITFITDASIVIVIIITSSRFNTLRCILVFCFIPVYSPNLRAASWETQLSSAAQHTTAMRWHACEEIWTDSTTFKTA